MRPLQFDKLNKYMNHKVKINLFNIERIYGLVQREEISLSKARNMVYEMPIEDAK